MVKFYFVILGIALPLLIKSIQGKTVDDNFKLVNLSKISAILLVYYSVLIYYYKYHYIDIDSFYFYAFIKITLSIVLILALLKYSPIRIDINRLVVFPRFEREPTIYFLLITFFLYTAFLAYMAVERHQDQVKQQILNAFVFIAIDNKPYFLTPVLILTELFTSIGEESVYRYFAINALKNNMKKNWVIIISALIWTLMHWNSSVLTFIIGVFIGYLYFETESLSLCITLHFIFNLTIDTEIFYVLYKEIGKLTFPAIQYAIAVFLLQIMLFLIIKIILSKTERVMTTSR